MHKVPTDATLFEIIKGSIATGQVPLTV